MVQGKSEISFWGQNITRSYEARRVITTRLTYLRRYPRLQMRNPKVA